MPLALDPQEKVELCLESDAQKPANERPVCLFRYLTCGQLRKVQDLRAQAETEEDNLKSRELVVDGLAVGMTGWKNMNGITFSREAMIEVFTLNELWELINRYPGEVTQSEIDKKKPASSSPSPGSTDKSASTAPAAESTPAESALANPASPPQSA